MKSFGKILGIILGIAVVAGGTCGILIAVNGGFKAQETVETPIPEPEPDPIPSCVLVVSDPDTLTLLSNLIELQTVTDPPSPTVTARVVVWTF